MLNNLFINKSGSDVMEAEQRLAGISELMEAQLDLVVGGLAAYSKYEVVIVVGHSKG